MSNINKKLFKRLHLNHAYGQLIALIFVPITILACVGAALVISETSNAARAQQKQMAIAILTRFQATSEYALDILSLYPWQYEQAHDAMQNMLNENIWFVQLFWMKMAKVNLALVFRSKRLGQTLKRWQFRWPDIR